MFLLASKNKLERIPSYFQEELVKIEIFLSLLLFSCNPMDCHTRGFLVFYYLPEFAQTHLDWVSYAIQQSHPLWPNSPSVINLSQHQSIFQWVDSVSGDQSIGPSALASVLPKNIQGWFPCCSRDSQESFPAPQLKSINTWSSALFMVQLSYPYMTTGKTIALARQTFVNKVMLFIGLS